MVCEMCGRESESLVRVAIEGSVLEVCTACSRFGKVIGAPAGVAATSGGNGGSAAAVQERIGGHQKRMTERDLYTELPDLELDPQWSKKVREAREKLGLTQEQFGAKINEKASVVHKLESGGMVPPDALVRKLERTLKVRLTAPPQAPSA
ncbi:MAG: TIGR00270 family protein [Euryarchaeota archaeon]|nr:TIGR00270 family protein [Euryarchaeota archaeon]MDE1835477.1 TIGR00270 family protein [Euryarchaeota archaeon]MDE1880370.1 TIGR00270 family protein [Euryarchaeota archaeon]MDE2045758.1 TIGR00270 family protein [Thermoplasmata archaeon]